MPRYSKKRTSTTSPYRRISHHKISVVSSFDKKDNLLLKLVILERGTTEMLKNSLGLKFKKAKLINADKCNRLLRIL